MDDDQLHRQRRHSRAREQPRTRCWLAGQLSPAAQANIINYVANTNNFAYSTPPTQTQMRDRVRAVVHLIASSPDYIIQK